jgi:hypothetical protein
MAIGLLSVLAALWIVGHVGVIAGRLTELVKGAA